MESSGKKEAQKLIAFLRTLSEDQYKDYLNKCGDKEMWTTVAQFKIFGFENAYGIQSTRKDFDQTYKSLSEAGIANPQQFLEQEADNISELMDNPDSIGRDFFSSLKAMRVKLAPYFTLKENVPVELVEATLRKLGHSSTELDADLSNAEKYYVLARRRIMSYTENEAYTSNAYVAPKDSSWANRIKAANTQNSVNLD